MSDDLLSGG